MAKRNATKALKPKSLTDGFEDVQGKKKSEKEQRTLFLKREPFERFQRVCRVEGKIVAHVIDEWIAGFLDQYDDVS